MAELIWDGKYRDGKRVAPVRLALPFQTVESVNESALDRKRTLDLLYPLHDPRLVCMNAALHSAVHDRQSDVGEASWGVAGERTDLDAVLRGQRLHRRWSAQRRAPGESGRSAAGAGAGGEGCADSDGVGDGATAA